MKDPSLHDPSPYFKRQVPDYNTPNYEDPEFPPSEESISFLDKKNTITKGIDSTDINSLKGLIWCRPSEIFGGKKYQVFEKILVDDIRQGVLGNCYFLSALASMAEFPDSLEKLFLNKTVSENGCYSFYFYIQGAKKIVTIDDRFPVFKSKQWALAHSKTNEIWVQLFEKAWAKVNNSYTMTISGFPSEALSALTSAPVITYFHKKFPEQALWEILKKCDDENFIMCTNTNSLANKSVGLVESHAYSIISCYEVENYKLLKIRNPWGNFEWNGDFGDKSELWTESLKAKVKFSIADDGIFYMTFNDFLKYFPVSFVCKFFEGFIYKYKRLVQFDEETMVGCRFTITKKTKAIFGLHQKQKRFYREKVEGYNPCYAKFFLVKDLGDNDYEYIHSNEANTDKVYLDLKEELDEGNYLLFGKLKWPYFETNGCSIIFSSYSNNDDLEFTNLDKSKIKDDYLIKIFESFIKKNCEYKALNPNIKNGISYINSLKDTDTGFFFLSFKNENRSKSCEVTFNIAMNDKQELLSKNLTVKKEGLLEIYTVIVAPESTELILFEQLDNVWLCQIACSSVSVNWDSVAFFDEDRRYILENKDRLLRERLFGLDTKCFYSELKRDNTLLLVIQNETDDDYLIKSYFRDLENCTLDYPNQSNLTFKLNSNSFDYYKLSQQSKGEINFEFKYSYKNLTCKEKRENMTTSSSSKRLY